MEGGGWGRGERGQRKIEKGEREGGGRRTQRRRETERETKGGRFTDKSELFQTLTKHLFIKILFHPIQFQT